MRQIEVSTEYFDIVRCKSGLFDIRDKETGRVNEGWENLDDAYDQALEWDRQMDDYGEVKGY